MGRHITVAIVLVLGLMVSRNGVTAGPTSARAASSMTRSLPVRTGQSFSSVSSPQGSHESRVLEHRGGRPAQARRASLSIRPMGPMRIIGAAVPPPLLMRGHQLPLSTCSGWVGLPYLNRYYVMVNNVCSYGIAGSEIGCTSGGSCLLGYNEICGGGCGLDLASGTYYMEDSVYLGGYTSGTLTLEAGATILVTAGSGSRLVLDSSGHFVAKGVSGTPVVITSAAGSPAPGDWGGICSSGGTIQAAYLQISYAGGGGQCGAGVDGGHTTIYSDNCCPSGGVTMSNSTIDYSAGPGMELHDSVPTLTGDTISNSTGPVLQWDVCCGSDTAPADLTSISGLTATNNVDNTISMPGFGNGYAGTGTWPNLGIPYHLQATLSINQGASLTISPGTTFQMRACGGQCRILVGGILLANGTAAQPITFTSDAATPSPGDWHGFYFDGGSSNSQVQLSYVTIAYAGAVDGGAGGAIYTTGSVPKVSATHTTIVHSSGIGVEISGGAPTLTNDTVSNSAGPVIQYDFVPAGLGTISGLTTSGNTDNEIIIPAGTDSGTGTWPNLGIAYHVVGGGLSINQGASLTIAPGSTVRMQACGGGCRIEAEGVLIANGTSTSPITFTSDAAAPGPGNWGGIRLRSGTSGSQATVSHSFISYAGGCFGPCAGVYIDGSYPVSITSSTINYSSSLGVEIAGGNPSLTGDAVVHNSGEAIQYDFAPGGGLNLSKLTINSNGANDISINAGTVNGTGAWPNAGGPYRLVGAVFIGNGTTLTIAPGVTVKMTPCGGCRIELASGASLVANGTRAQPITFTSAAAVPKPGDWTGIRVINTNISLQHVTIRYAGGCYSTCGALYLDSSSASASTITNTIIDHSGSNDLEINNPGTDTFRYDSFLSVPAGNEGVKVDSGTVVDFSHNFWGSSTGPFDPNSNPTGFGTVENDGHVTDVPFLGFTVSPSSGAQNSTATASGTGFAPNETVALTWIACATTCTSTILKSVAADANGAFNTTLTIPAGVVGRTDIVQATGSVSQISLTSTFTVTS